MRLLIFRILSLEGVELLGRLVPVISFLPHNAPNGLLESGSDFVARSGFRGEGDSDLTRDVVRFFTGDKSTMSVPDSWCAHTTLVKLASRTPSGRPAGKDGLESRCPKAFKHSARYSCPDRATVRETGRQHHSL